MTVLLGTLLFLAAAVAPAPAPLTLHTLPLPGSPGRIVMDYLGYDSTTNRVWVPAGNTGKVFVVDAATEKISTLDGFATRTAGNRLLGPSSITFGAGMAFVGNRADASVCAFAAATLAKRFCVTLPDAPDGLAFVATTREVWATTPASKSLTLLSLSGSGLAVAAHVPLDGVPEGYAVDPETGRFFTNLEDRSETLLLDARTRRVTRRWPNGCGAEGPRGLALDLGAHRLVVACTDAVVSFPSEGTPTPLGRFVTGGGVDNIDLVSGPARVFVAAGRAEKLLRIRIKPDGTLEAGGEAVTSKGVRVVVVTRTGQAFAADSAQGRLWVSTP